MPKRSIDFTSKEQYVRNTVDLENVSKFYKMLEPKKSVPAFEKEKLASFKHTGLPRFLQVIFEHIEYI